MITIEELTPANFELVAGWLSRPETNRWLTAEWRGRVAASVVVAMAVRNRKNRLFLVRCSGQACGLTALADIDTADRTAMLWYVLGEHTLSGRGIMLAAVKQLARLVSNSLGLRRYMCGLWRITCRPDGWFRRLGFVKQGGFVAQLVPPGRQVDRIYFDLLPCELH